MTENLGKKIKSFRELRNFTQEYMAFNLGISQTSYGNIERNEVEITVKRLYEICKLLDVNIGSLLNFDDKTLKQNAPNTKEVEFLQQTIKILTETNKLLTEKLT